MKGNLLISLINMFKWKILIFLNFPRWHSFLLLFFENINELITNKSLIFEKFTKRK